MAKGDLIQKLVKWTSLGKNEVVRSHVTKNISPNVKAALTVIVKKNFLRRKIILLIFFA